MCLSRERERINRSALKFEFRQIVRLSSYHRETKGEFKHLE